MFARYEGLAHFINLFRQNIWDLCVYFTRTILCLNVFSRCVFFVLSCVRFSLSLTSHWLFFIMSCYFYTLVSALFPFAVPVVHLRMSHLLPLLFFLFWQSHHLLQTFDVKWVVMFPNILTIVCTHLCCPVFGLLLFFIAKTSKHNWLV